jgi:hypothetical protein
MKTGYWNYIEQVRYTVVLVRLKSVEKPHMHWQNAFAGQQRQALQVFYFTITGECKTFLIDNEDGSGLFKAEGRGGPDYMSRHIELENCELLHELEESLWNRYDEQRRRKIDEQIDSWQKEHYPEDFEKLQALKAAILRMP